MLHPINCLCRTSRSTQPLPRRINDLYEDFNLNPKTSRAEWSAVGVLDVSSKMNRLSIEFTEEKDEEGDSYRGVRLIVDGADFRALVKSFETTHAKKEGHPDLAGDYHWLDAAYTSSEVLLGQAEREYGISDDKVALMGCSCGVVSCWPLECRVDVVGSTVTWNEFGQPHRSVDSAASFWDYSDFGPFVFDRAEYLEAIGVLDSKS